MLNSANVCSPRGTSARFAAGSSPTTTPTALARSGSIMLRRLQRVGATVAAQLSAPNTEPRHHTAGLAWLVETESAGDGQVFAGRHGRGTC